MTGIYCICTGRTDSGIRARRVADAPNARSADRTEAMREGVAWRDFRAEFWTVVAPDRAVRWPEVLAARAIIAEDLGTKVALATKVR